MTAGRGIPFPNHGENRRTSETSHRPTIPIRANTWHMSQNDLYACVRETVLAALLQVVPDLPEEIAARVEVSPTKDPGHGDMATNAAMVSAKAARQPPAKIAAALVQHLAGAPDIASAEAAGPGFVNLRLRPDAFRALLPVVLASGEAYGDATVGNGTKVNVEYVSANPTGPMHIGHCRGAVVGDALANLLIKGGFDVTKEYYINDAGAQVTALAWAAYWRYLQAIGSPMTEAEFAAEVPGGLQYRGDYLIAVGTGPGGALPGGARHAGFGDRVPRAVARYGAGPRHRRHDGRGARGPAPARRPAGRIHQ